MNFIEQLLAKFDPATFSVTALVYIAVFAFLIWFFVYGWPHYTKNVAPQRAKLREMQVTAQIENERLRLQSEIDKDRQQTEALTGIRDALIEIKVMSGQIAKMVERQDPQLSTVVDKLAA
jgi:hypothetical protein